MIVYPSLETKIVARDYYRLSLEWYSDKGQTVSTFPGSKFFRFETSIAKFNELHMSNVSSLDGIYGLELDSWFGEFCFGDMLSIVGWLDLHSPMWYLVLDQHPYGIGKANCERVSAETGFAKYCHDTLTNSVDLVSSFDGVYVVDTEHMFRKRAIISNVNLQNLS